jgi:hypothetical protein
MKLYDGGAFLAGLVLIGIVTFIFATDAQKPAVDAVKEEVSIEKNAETGLTDVTVGDKTISLDVEDLDAESLND